MSNEINEIELKKDIYVVMKKYFHGFNEINHEVAMDFTSVEIDAFVRVYYDYLLK